MDTDRFNVEQSYIEIIRELIRFQQQIVQQIKETKSAEVIKKLKESQKQNEDYIRLCHEQKEFSGRNAETVLIKTLEISKGIMTSRAELEQEVKSPLNEKNLGMSELSPEKIEEHKELYTRGWEKFTYRQLPAEEKLKLLEKVSHESEDMLSAARMRIQERQLAEMQKESKE